jgi:hypothetical protein
LYALDPVGVSWIQIVDPDVKVELVVELAGQGFTSRNRQLCIFHRLCGIFLAPRLW